MLMNLESLAWDPTLCRCRILLIIYINNFNNLIIVNFKIFRYFNISPNLLPEIRSSSEIYGYLAGGLLQGVPISGVRDSFLLIFTYNLIPYIEFFM